MFAEVHRQDFRLRAQSRDIPELHDLYLTVGRGRAPHISAFDVPLLERYARNLMRLEPLADGSYRYTHYGQDIAEIAAFDLTGHTTADFEGPQQGFFEAVYRESAQTQAPLFTIHRAVKASMIHTWEGLVLPVLMDDGATAFIVYNRPREFAQDFLQSMLNVLPDGIVALRAMRQADGMLTDAQIISLNPAAIALIGLPPGRITGRVLPSLFADKGGDALQDMLTVASNGGRGAAYGLTLAENGARVAAQASLFRQDGAACFLIRLTGPSDRERGDGPATTAIEALIDRLPDAFVVTDAAGALQRVNGAFLDMAGLATAGAAVGQNLDQWLGRAGVDFNVLKASMREGGVVRNFSTVLRSAYGAVDTVEISAVGGIGDAADHLGFIIRPAGRSGSEPGPSALPRSAEEFKQLVGRVPLKELVRETSDIIEKLCIEAALEMTGNNRASAADMLGLSRQGLYAKLHRFGIGDLSGQD